MATSTAWIEDPTEFAELAGEWDALLPPDAHPFDLHCWYASWWKAFAAEDRLAVVTARRDGRLVGVYPLRRHGGELLGLSNSHSPTYRPLAVDEEAMDAMFAAAAADMGRGLVVRGVPTEDPSVAWSEAEARAASVGCLTEHAFDSPYIDTRGSYDEWREANKHRWKAPLERKWRKMERDHEADFRLVESPPDLGPELDEGLRIEASGWKGKNGTAIDSSPDSAAFYRDVCRAFLERDELRFNWIFLDGKAVSFDLCFLYRNRLYTQKSGFDEDYKSLAPGLVHRLAIIKRCFELGIDEHDLLGENVGWKQRFSSGLRSHVDLRFFPRGPAGAMRYRYRAQLRPRLKSAYRRVRPLE